VRVSPQLRGIERSVIESNKYSRIVAVLGLELLAIVTEGKNHSVTAIGLRDLCYTARHLHRGSVAMVGCGRLFLPGRTARRVRCLAYCQGARQHCQIEPGDQQYA
jgi:hypothetical protein